MFKPLPILGLILVLGVCFSPQIFRAPKETVVATVATEADPIVDPQVIAQRTAAAKKKDLQRAAAIQKQYESGFDPVYESRAKATLLSVSLSRREVSFYSYGSLVKTFPIAIGQTGWDTPPGKFKVMQMLEYPDWVHPLTHEHIPSGNPKNPLGNYWIGFWTDGQNWIGFHGTPDRNSVGQAISHGCIRMYNEDIEELFYAVVPGTTVIVKR